MREMSCGRGNVHLKMVYAPRRRLIFTASRQGLSTGGGPRELGSIMRCVLLFCPLLEMERLSRSLFRHITTYIDYLLALRYSYAV